MEMLKYRSGGLRRGVLGFVLLAAAPHFSAFAAEELPAPPPLTDDLSMPDASAGAELPPPPPGEEIPSTTADVAAPPNAASVDTPVGEEIPPLPLEGDPTDQATLTPPEDPGLTDIPSEPLPPAQSAPRTQEPTRFSSNQELEELGMEDRLKSKDLVLWLHAGGSYGSLTAKGSYSVGNTATVGGMGYDVGIGWKLEDFLQMQLDVSGTPRSRTSSVQHAMVGIGPRLGILSVMALVGAQRGEVFSGGVAGPEDTSLAIGVKGGLDLIFKHYKDSRASLGIAPEAFYITTQGSDGYTNMGISVNLRIYGYDSAF
jgi:hypothetical protein